MSDTQGLFSVEIDVLPDAAHCGSSFRVFFACVRVIHPCAVHVCVCCLGFVLQLLAKDVFLRNDSCHGPTEVGYLIRVLTV